VARFLDPDRVLGLVFDLDGTLVDSYAAIASSVNHARGHYGLPPLPTEEVRTLVGHGLESLIGDVVGEDRVEDGVRLFREAYARVFAEATLPCPGALEVVSELHRRGYRLSVASNKPARFGERILERLGMLPFLDAVQGPDRAGSTKPAPAMVELCLEAMRVPAAGGAYVGDMVLDVETAARAALPVILVQGGSSSPAELKDTGELVLGGLTDLLDLLEGVK
jgi:phosphoglycolate phosphatase